MVHDMNMGRVELLRELQSYSATENGRVDLRREKKCRRVSVVHVRTISCYTYSQYSIV